MVFAPGGDRGCPHQPVSVVMCISLFILTVSIVWPFGHELLVLAQSKDGYTQTLGRYICHGQP